MTQAQLSNFDLLDPPADLPAGTAAKDKDIDQGIRPQSVMAMDASRHLTRYIEAGNIRLTIDTRLDPSILIMLGGIN
jgi:hypothetical protein